MSWPRSVIIDCINAHKRGIKFSQIARKYGPSASAISLWCKEPEKYLKDEFEGLTPPSPAINERLPVGRDANDGYSPSPKKDGFSFRIGVLPDVQAKPGLDFTFLSHIGRYFASKRPDVIVNIGDFADMPSLPSHDTPGAKSVEGRKRYFDGKPCKAGHVAPKFTRNKTCVKCWLSIRSETSSTR